jgi:polar amino acid transport system substrate-binding protein
MRKLLIVLAAFAVIAAACAEDEPTTTGTTGPTPAADECNPPPLKTAGVLNVAAEHPYYEPFLIGKQANPTGFEADVINEIASRMGVDTVEWTNIAFDQLYAPGAKNWDLGVSEITITAERDEVVDFSEPYFVANQGILVRADSQYASATTLEEIKDAKFGAEAGTTGLAYIEENVQPTQDVSQFDTTDAAAQALKVGTIDIQVIDVPIAIGLRDQSEDVELVVIGEFITNENYGLTFEEGNPLKACVDEAIISMTDDGFLEAAQLEWFPGSTPLTEF